MIELRTEFDYQIRYSMICINDENPEDMSLTLNVTPAFKGYNSNIIDDCVVMDLYVLDHILQMQGTVKYYLLTCECDVAEDVGIMSPAAITVTSSEIQIDFFVNDYKEVLEDKYTSKEGETLRIIFDRQQYISKFTELMKTLKLFYKEGVMISALTESDFTRSYHSWRLLQELKQQYPSLQRFWVGGINPHDAAIEEWVRQYPLC